MPIDIPVFAAMSKAFTKIHARCPKTYTEPTPEESAGEYERQCFWLQNGEHGTSSETIFSVLSRRSILDRNKWGHPYDPDDFRRCHLLLQCVPSWRSRIGEMGMVSSVWAALADNWDKLTAMLEETIEKRKDVGMYEFMKTLGC